MTEENNPVKLVRCYLCDKENAHPGDLKYPFPQELYYSTETPEQVPYCSACYSLKSTIDATFMIFCREAKLMEWYKSASRKKSSYYLSRWVFNLDINTLRELYFQMFKAAVDADKKSNDEEWRKQNEEQFNYEWRKRDV